MVQDRSDSFNYVELDIKFEQSIQRASNSQGGIIGQSRMFAVVMEFDDKTELPETVIAQVEEYLLLGWAGARSKP